MGDALSPNRVSYSELAVGDCVQQPAGWDDAGSDLDEVGIETVSCTKTHWGEVYHMGKLGGIDYPGDDQLLVRVEDLCFSENAAMNVAQEHVDEAFVSYIMPTVASWMDGDREVICFIADEDHTLTESWIVEP